MGAVLVDLSGGLFGWAGELTAGLAQEPPPPPGKGPEFGKSSPVGLVVVLLLAVATVLLIRSMTKHLRRVPASFDPPEPADKPPASGDEAARDAGDAGGNRA